MCFVYTACLILLGFTLLTFGFRFVSRFQRKRLRRNYPGVEGPDVATFQYSGIHVRLRTKCLHRNAPRASGLCCQTRGSDIWAFFLFYSHVAALRLCISRTCHGTREGGVGASYYRRSHCAFRNMSAALRWPRIWKVRGSSRRLYYDPLGGYH